MRVARISVDTGKVAYLGREKSVVFDLVMAANGRVAAVTTDVQTPPRLVALEGANERALSAHNAWVVERKFGQVREVAFRNGEVTIHGWLMLPPGHVDGQRLPLAVQLHGGPVGQFDYSFDLDARIFAAHGYAVLALNPRGSSGRGFEFARAIWQDWGNLDVKDISAGIDYAIASGIADPKRIGIWGWSYGGVLGNFMLAREPRIRAAIVGAGIGNEIQMWGVDIYAHEYNTEWGTPFDQPELWHKLSYPFYEAGKIRAPALYLCAGDDWNVPCSGSDQMYLALKTLGVPTQLVVYPGESHGLQVPSYVADRTRRSIAWMDRWLAPERQQQPTR